MIKNLIYILSATPQQQIQFVNHQLQTPSCSLMSPVSSEHVAVLKTSAGLDKEDPQL